MNNGPKGNKIVLPNGKEAPFSSAFRSGDLLFLSGVIPIDSNGNICDGDIETQTHLCFSQIEQTLLNEGLSKKDIVKLTIWLVDKNDFFEFNKAYANELGEHKPARSTVQSELVVPNAKIEIEAIAAYCL